MKQKAFFKIFKGLSMKQITQFFLEEESPTLSIFFCRYSLNLFKMKLLTSIAFNISVSQIQGNSFQWQFSVWHKTTFGIINYLSSNFFYFLTHFMLLISFDTP